MELKFLETVVTSKRLVFDTTKRRPEMKIWKYASLIAASAFVAGTLLASPARQDQQPAPDNTKTNQGDASKDATTAQQQKMNPADRNTTKQIRSEIMSDKTLYTYAHNIKVITQNGKVTLKGQVRSDDEKANIEAK